MESADGWIEHDGKGAPDLPEDTQVQVRLRHPKHGPIYGTYDDFDWRHIDFGDDIIAYRVVKP